MGKAERIEIEDFVQNIVERMETPEAFEKRSAGRKNAKRRGRRAV